MSQFVSMLSAHYRSPINYSRDSLIQAQNALSRLYTAVENLEFLHKNGVEGAMKAEEIVVTETFSAVRTRFQTAMDDDMNTADAVGVIFELVRAVNIAVETTPTALFAQTCLDMILELTDVLGLLYERKTEESLDSQVESLIAGRQQARKDKNFAEADRIRDVLKEMKIELMDTPQGVKWKQL